MNTDLRDRARLLRRLAWTGTGAVFALIVLGGIVRITGSGMGCGDHWPRCNGEWFPPLDLPTLIESSHRWVAALVSMLVFAIAVVAWRRHRSDAPLRRPALTAAVLLIVQVLLGAVTVWHALPPWVVITHLANAMILLAVIMTLALRTTMAPGETASLGRHAGHPWIMIVAAFGFGVILLGGQVANFHAGMMCLGFPFCGDSFAPPTAPLAKLHWTHRLFAYGFVVIVLGLVARVYQRKDPGARALKRATTGVLAATLLQVAVGAGMVLHLMPATLRAAHLLVGTAVWAALVVLVFVSSRTAPGDAVDLESKAPVPPSLGADLVTLTKPRIISLLLLTTLAPMFITPAGLPSWAQLFWVTIGGYLMAGGANTINMWFDRDIDREMGRTRQRPIPSGRISPAAGLAFGLALGAIAFGLFWHFVNPLSAWLALGGLLFYVFIYTMWLKRTSPQNIVIGGAAGAFPPLVGWAAMTGSIDLAAIYLFAIIFYWTPPHFWALALVKRAEYARAGVPMMPVVRGEQRTKVEMLIYTLMLLPLTILPTFFGALGTFYAVAAGLLGARLLWYCIQLLREETTNASRTGTAWRMYRYSLLYLALLFVAMGIDRALPFGHHNGPEGPDPNIVILKR